MSAASYRIFCLYASMKGDEPSPWMIAAEDEYSWDGDPERCTAVFKAAEALAARNDWDVREVTIVADINLVYKAFEPAEVPGEIEPGQVES